MKRTIGLVAMCVLLLGVSIKAQAPAMPKPGPEVKKLAYFVGNWKEVGEAKPGPMGPGGKFTSISKWDWMSGGFFLEAHMDMTSTMGKSKALGVMGYDPNTKMYTYNEFDSMGGAITATGTNNGDTWNWTSEMVMDGKPMKTRVTIKEVSKTEYTFKLETSTDGSTWTTGMEATDTKVMAAAPAAAPKKN